MSLRYQVEELVYRVALLLDGGEFQAYLDLCAPDFQYVIGAYSPEIRREMVWLDHDKPALQSLFDTLPRHNSDHTPLSRHVTLYTVDAAPDGDTASAVSALQVFRTALDGGATELYAVGKIYDTVSVSGGAARLTRRRIRLDTRMLGIGSHIPL